MKIVHVIDSLALGGTENQFLALLPDLAKQHEIHLVTLTPDEQPGLDPLRVAGRHHLNFTGAASLPTVAMKLRRIIARERPDLVRSQLYWSSLVARLATPRSVPLAFSIESTMSRDAYAARRLALWLDKLTYRPRHHLISVSQEALTDFDRHVGIKGTAEVLTNFVDRRFFRRRREGPRSGSAFRLVAVGNLKAVKNHALLIEAMRGMDAAVECDIYGEGPLRGELEDRIAESATLVRLRGAQRDLWNILPEYDLFVMPSLYEGCPIAAMEAMAAGVPLALSDIPAMHEVSRGNALFFDHKDPRSLSEVIERARSGAVDLAAMSRIGVESARTDFTKDRYLDRINAAYSQLVASSANQVV